LSSSSLLLIKRSITSFFFSSSSFFFVCCSSSLPKGLRDCFKGKGNDWRPVFVICKIHFKPYNNLPFFSVSSLFFPVLLILRCAASSFYLRYTRKVNITLYIYLPFLITVSPFTLRFCSPVPAPGRLIVVESPVTVKLLVVWL